MYSIGCVVFYFFPGMKALTQSIEDALILTSSKPSDAELDEDMVGFQYHYCKS